MNIERELIISILKLAKDNSVLHENINKDAKIPSETVRKLLQKLQNEDLVYLEENKINIDSAQRLNLTVRAIELGADIERVSNFLHWQEFESMASAAFELTVYATAKNVRLKNAS